MMTCQRLRVRDHMSNSSKYAGHTPGPWEIVDEETSLRIDCDEACGLANIPIASEGGAFSRDRQVANARRIVECVNACDGIENPADLVAANMRLRDLVRLCGYYFDKGLLGWHSIQFHDSTTRFEERIQAECAALTEEPKASSEN